MTLHYFNVNVAKEVGVKASVVLTCIAYLLDDDGFERREFDGTIWVKCSVEALSDRLGYLSNKQVRSALYALNNLRIIRSDYLSHDLFDRTLWHTIVRHDRTHP